MVGIMSGIWFSTAENTGCSVHAGNLQHTLKIFLLMNFNVI